MYINVSSRPANNTLHMSGLSMLSLDRHRQNGYSIESFVVYQRGSPVGIKKKIKKELIGTSDYPSNKIFTISNFITFTRLILTKERSGISSKNLRCVIFYTNKCR